MYESVVTALHQPKVDIYHPGDGSELRDETLLITDLSRYRSGVSDPGWRQKVLSGQDATTDFSASVFRVTKYVEGYAFVRYRSETGYARDKTWRGPIRSAIYGPRYNVTLASTTATALERFVRKAKEELTPFQGGVFLGELGKTLRMIRNPASNLTKAFGTYHERLKKVPHRRSSAYRRKALADTYLEATYGWTPLIYDLNGGIQALKTLAAKRPEIKRIAAKASEADSWHSTENAPSGYSQLLVDMQFREEVSSWITGGINVSTDGTGRPLEILGLDFSSFAPTAWELLPYSFLADYFANIGSIIDAWSLVNNRLVWCCETNVRNFRQSSRNLRFGPSDLVDSIEQVVRSGHFDVQKRWVYRSRRQSVIPDFRFRLPGFGSRQSLNTAVLALSKAVRTPFY